MTTDTKPLTLAARLRALRACVESCEWAKSYGKDCQRAWQECEHGDWMLWLAGYFSGLPESDGRKKLVLCACECARLALSVVADSRVVACIETAERWARDEATMAQLRRAKKHADPDNATDDTDAIADSACAAADAADHASHVVVCVAHATAAAARLNMLPLCADIVRAHYPTPPGVSQ